MAWAEVGGQGYVAASVAASFPAESVPVVGGPTVPSTTWKFLEGKMPALFVPVSTLNGSVHETGTGFPATSIVG